MYNLNRIFLVLGLSLLVSNKNFAQEVEGATGYCDRQYGAGGCDIGGNDGLPSSWGETGGSNSSGDSGQQSNGGAAESNQSSPENTTPVDPPKTPRQLCLEDVAVRYSTCRASASGTYARTLETDCLGQGNISVNGGVNVGVGNVGGGLSIDEYNQCKDSAESIRENSYDVCLVLKDTQTRNCP